MFFSLAPRKQALVSSPICNNWSTRYLFDTGGTTTAEQDFPHKEQTILKAQCKKDVTPLLMHWSYIFLALTHRYVASFLFGKNPAIVGIQTSPGSSMVHQNCEILRLCSLVLNEVKTAFVTCPPIPVCLKLPDWPRANIPQYPNNQSDWTKANTKF